LAYLLKYDSVYGTYKEKVSADIKNSKLIVGSQKIDFPYTYAGWVSNDTELAKLYQGSVFVNTGKHEALPMPPLEAMACGKPVIGTEVGGIPDQIIAVTMDS
jgi:glycosyltransferase involved in cell wall biosynthesis